MPKIVKRWILIITSLLAVLTWVPLSLIAMSRTQRPSVPRIAIIQDMDWQPYFRAQSASPLFADGRSMRPKIAGTISRSEVKINNDHFMRGLVKDDFFTGGYQWADTFPVAVNDEMLARGRERFNIYCTPCHGYSGYGNGPVAQRADSLAQGTWTPPLSLHSDIVKSRPVGQIFNTITNGIRNMPAYGSQIPPEDRWAIIAYVRALERSQSSKISDQPEDIRQRLGAAAAAGGSAKENPELKEDKYSPDMPGGSGFEKGQKKEPGAETEVTGKSGKANNGSGDSGDESKDGGGAENESGGGGK